MQSTLFVMRKIIILCIIILSVCVFHQCVNSKYTATKLSYVGSDKCQSCHKEETKLFETSDHFHAMDSALPANVKADFNNTQFIYSGDTAFFSMRNGGYFVRTTDTSGVKKEFKVDYTFGWTPLQQYLVRFDDGRIQVLPFCWDTRPKEKGGQRWFHLYNKEKIAPDDELFWMGFNQNWNYMCADCHTTDFKKNFNLSNNNFQSTWGEQRVSCESCHGPASGHMEWTKNKDAGLAFTGFAISLAEKKMDWRWDTARQTMIPSNVIKNDTLIETCARCHARATRFSDDYVHGKPFMQTHTPSTANSTFYYIDGQIKDEDYEYASFLQSKMYAAGVTCINCHNAHSMKIKATGNSLCASCHSPKKYDGPQHSYHLATSTGNQCVSCHMPVTTYMVVDDRLDHSIRIPRPDQSLTMGTPNACNKCHTDKSVQWAASSFEKWYGEKLKGKENYAELMHNIASYVSSSEPSLYQLLSSKNYPAMMRATAMEQYGYFTSPRVSKLVFEELKSPDAFLRLNALKALAAYPAETVMAQGSSLLSDPIKAVRMEAVNLLAPYLAQLQGVYKNSFQQAMAEYLNVQEQMSHRPEGIFNRAIMKSYSNDFVAAEELYKTCLNRYPTFIPTYANLIDLYRQQGREDEAKKIIDRGLKKFPNSAFLHYTAGLWHIRNKDVSAGIAALQKAAATDTQDERIVYAYAVGLFSTGETDKAVQTLENYVAKYGYRPTILDGLISICLDAKKAEKANKYLADRKSIFGY